MPALAIPAGQPFGRERAFLDVARSVSGRRWTDRLDAAGTNLALAMHQKHGLDELVARVLAGRGVSLEEAGTFLTPTLRELMVDPSAFAGMDEAASRLARAIENKERVAIFGDYDVDGATSSALLARYLRGFGLDPAVYIPDRIFEGYGPNPAAISQLVDEGATLVITVDCGATSFEPVLLARQKGADTLVLDHHQVGTDLPEAIAIVNPNRQDDLSGQGHLAAVGVVFMTLVAVNRELRRRDPSRRLPDLKRWLDLVALGTVCDVVPLRGLNRAFVNAGLQTVRNRGNAGLAALARVARQDGPPTPYHLGFLLGPRINAGGRIGDAALGAKLLMSDDAEEAEAIAARLEALNRERQAMERHMLREAVEEAEGEIGTGEGPPVIITARETWHAGVVGLLASRLKDRFRRPAFAVSLDDRGIGTGSGRSVSGVDLGAAVRAAVDEGLLEKGGGHAMAAGLTVRRDKLPALRAFMEERLGQAVRNASTRDTIAVDAAMTARAATAPFVETLERAGPFGAGHPKPVMALPHHTVRYANVIKGQHVSFRLASRDGAELNGIAFRIADQPLGEALLSDVGRPMHFVGTLDNDFYRGASRVKFRLLDAAEPETAR